MLIDTHAHLYLEHFREDLEAVVERCREMKVRKVVLPNIDMPSIPDLHRVCDTYPDLFLPAVGLHPCSVNANWEEELAQLRSVIDDSFKGAASRRIVGIGEAGLDYYWDLTYKDEQHEALRIQVQWAKELGLPIILHCRDSFDDLYSIISELNDEDLTGIFHCFTGTEEEAHKIMDLGGFLMGLGGVLTFRKSTELREVAARIPLEHFVLETDSPYLTPAPYRGKRNESSYVRFVADTLADATGRTIEEIEAITTENAARMFGASIL